MVSEKILFRFVLLNPPAGEVAVAPPDPLQNHCQHFLWRGEFRGGRKNKLNLLPTDQIIHRLRHLVLPQI
jgi:hypothetical protein